MLSCAKGYQFQSINELINTKMINEKKNSANNSFNNDTNLRSNSPIRNLNNPSSSNLTASPKGTKVVKGGNSNLQLNNNTNFKPDTIKSLTPTSSIEKPGISFNAYNSNNGNTNTGFYNKLLQNNNTNDVKKLGETKRSINDKTKKLDMEMKILEEDFNDDNLKESYYNNNKKEDEKEREKQSTQQPPKKKTGILNLFSKILPK
jgi:hypothetical protein